MYKNDFIKYHDDDIRKDLKLQQNLLDKAIISGHVDDWRNFKNFKNNLNKVIKKQKKEYLDNKFNKSTEKWKLLKKIKG